MILLIASREREILFLSIGGPYMQGVISRELRGRSHPLLKFLLILGGSAPLTFLQWPSFLEFIGFASKVL